MALKSNKMYILSFSIFIYMFSGSWIFAPVKGARILAVETVGGKSHWNYMSGILRALVNNGHNITVFTPFVDGNRENYTEVDISMRSTKFLDGELLDLMDKYRDQYKLINQMPKMSRNMCNILYENSKMKEMLSDTPSEFDVVLTEPLFSECVSYVAIKLNLPLIYVVPLPTMGSMERLFTGHISNPAVVSNSIASFGLPKTFVQRTTNTAFLIYSTIITKLNELILMHTEPKEYDLHEPIPPSLIFVNRHYTVEPASPIPSNVVEIGGIHLKAAEKLPKVRAIVKGVIY